MEGFESVELFAHAGKLDRLAGNRAHGERRTAARIAVHPGQDHAGQRHFVTEALRHVDRVLTGQAVDHQQDFGRRRHRSHGLHLGHQRFVDMQAARGIEQHHIDIAQLRRFERAASDVHRLLAFDDRQRIDVRLLAQHRQLFLRSGAIDVERGHHGLLAVLLANQLGELGRAGRLTRALQADHHDDDRRLGFEGQRDMAILAVPAAEHRDQLVVDDLDNLLAGGDRLEDGFANGLFGDLLDEVARNGQRDIGFEQRDSHFAHRIAHVLLAQGTAPAQAVEGIAKAIRQCVEHLLDHSISGEEPE